MQIIRVRLTDPACKCSILSTSSGTYIPLPHADSCAVQAADDAHSWFELKNGPTHVVNNQLVLRLPKRQSPLKMGLEWVFVSLCIVRKTCAGRFERSARISLGRNWWGMYNRINVWSVLKFEWSCILIKDAYLGRVSSSDQKFKFCIGNSFRTHSCSIFNTYAIFSQCA